MYVVIPMFVTGPEFGHSTHIDLLETKTSYFQLRLGSLISNLLRDMNDKFFLLELN